MAMLLHYSWMVLYVLIVMVAMLLARFTVTVVISMGYLPALEVDHPVLFHSVDTGLCLLVGLAGVLARRRFLESSYRTYSGPPRLF